MDDTIRVRVRAFAAVREALGTGELEMELPTGIDLNGLLAELARRYPAAPVEGRRVALAVNRAYVPPETTLHDGDEVALIPPVSGGAGGIDPPAKLFEITDAPLSLDEVARRVAGPENGGITVFAGTVRGSTPSKRAGELGAQTDYLEYEAFTEMAEATLEQIAGEVRQRWPAISTVSIMHRTGRLEVGDLAVVIAVAATHRADTFPACKYAIDRLKEIAPLWKREVGPDGTAWIEGPESAPGPGTE